MAYPSLVGTSSNYISVVDGTALLPSSLKTGDLLLLFVETNNFPVITPLGWDLLATPIGAGALNSPTSTRLTVFKQTHGGGGGPPFLPMNGADHIFASTIAWRHVSGTPRVEMMDMGALASASSTVTYPILATKSDENYGMGALANSTDTVTAQGGTRTLTNTGWSTTTERMDANTTQGDGGGLTIFEGLRTTAQTPTTGVSQALTTASVQEFMVLSIAPPCKNMQLAPYVRSVGPLCSAVGSVQCRVPPDFIANDLLLMFVETSNEAIASPPAGWTQVGSMVGVTGTNPTALHVYRRSGNLTPGSLTAAFGGTDHTFAVMLAVAMPDDSVPDTASIVTATSTEATNATAISMPAVTTTAANSLVISACAIGSDVAGVVLTGLLSGGSGTGLQTVMQRGTTTGNGGGLVIGSCTKATAGASGNLAGTLAAGTVQARMTLAIKGLDPKPGKNKHWTGSAWVEKPLKYWSGSAWTTKPVKKWNGVSWI